MHDCGSPSCELRSLKDDELVTIEFTDADGNTLEMHQVNPRAAEQLMYAWCLEHLAEKA